MSIETFGWPTAPSTQAPLAYRYDRTVEDAFLDLFLPGAPLQVLVEYARDAPYPLDLQFRRSIQNGAQRAVLYAGLQAVLTVHWQMGRVRLDGHSKYAKHVRFGFKGRWGERMPADGIADEMDAIEQYLELVIPKVSPSAKEGAVQAAIATFSGGNGAILDREFAPQFVDEATREQVLDDVTADLRAIVEPLSARGQLPPMPERFGPRCDVLAVRNGRFETIEVKPRGVSSLVWSPIQVIVYARLVRRWLEDDLAARSILERIAEQRRRIGLIRSTVPLPDADAVIPVIAIQQGPASTYRDGLREVAAALHDAGIAEAEQLEVDEVSLTGRMRRLQ